MPRKFIGPGVGADDENDFTSWLKRIIIVLAVGLLFASCKKEGQCYTCTFGTSGGITPPPQDYCGPMPHEFRDAQGNQLNSYCIEK